MDKKFSRLEALIGKENLDKLKSKKVIVFGVGGVGGFVIESLVRSGLEDITIVDNDVVDESNINRQIIATSDSLGKSKVEIMKERAISINTNAQITAIQKFYLPENEMEFDLSKYDYVIDCVDTVSAKLSIICRSKEANVPVISALGAGNKLDPTKLKVSDISKTEYDPLAKVIRRELRKRNIKDVKVVYSSESPINIVVDENEYGRHSPASAIFVPACMGILIAKTVIDDLINF